MVPRPTRREEEGRKLRREGNGLCSAAGVKRDPGRLEHAGKGEGSEIRTADCRSEKKGKKLRRGKCHPFGLRRRLPFLMRVGRATSRGAPQGAEARSATVGRDTGRGCLALSRRVLSRKLPLRKVRGHRTHDAEPQGAELQIAGPRGTQPQGAEAQVARPQDAQPTGAETRAVGPQGAQPQGAEPQAVGSQGAQPQGAEPHAAEPQVLSCNSPGRRALSRQVPSLRVSGHRALSRRE